MTDPSTLLSEMDLPDEVVEKAAKAMWQLLVDEPNSIWEPWEQMHQDYRDGQQKAAQLAIRAALQAMCDCGMAKVETRPLVCGCEGPPSVYAYQILSIRLDTKREEQKSDKKGWAHYEGREEDEQYEL